MWRVKTQDRVKSCGAEGIAEGLSCPNLAFSCILWHGIIAAAASRRSHSSGTTNYTCSAHQRLARYLTDC